MGQKISVCKLTLLFFIFSIELSGSAIAAQVQLLVENDWFPYAAEVNGNISGFSVDVMRAAFKARGVGLQLSAVPFARCSVLVDQGKAAGCFQSIFNKAAGKQRIFPRTPLFVAKMAVYATAPTVNKVKVVSLEGHVVGVTNGYYYGQTIEGNQRIRKDVAPSDIANLRKLAAGRIDYAILDPFQYSYIVHGNPDLFSRNKFYQVGIVGKVAMYPFFSRVNPEGRFAAAVYEKGMADVKRFGECQKIEKHWHARFVKVQQ